MINPKVSVVMTSYQYGAYLSEAIDSVLKQSFQDFELLIIDDGSTDESISIIQKYVAQYPHQVRFLQHEHQGHQGLQNSLKVAINEARGVFLAFCESDDCWSKDNLLLKVQALETHTNLAVVYGSLQLIGSPVSYRRLSYVRWIHLFGRFFFQYHKKFIYPTLKFNPVATFTNFVLRKQHLSDFAFDKQMEVWSDLQMLIHLSLKGDFAYIPEAIVWWRQHMISMNTRFSHHADLKKYVLAQSTFLTQMGFAYKWVDKVRIGMLKAVFILRYPLVFFVH